MKVLYCILDNRVGGPHRRAYSISLRLRRDDIETVFLTGRKTDDVWQSEGATVVQLKHIQCFQRRWTLLNLLRFLFWLPCNLWRIRRLIRRKGIDIVHVDGVTNFVPALAAAITGRPVVWTYNDHLPGLVKRPLLWLLNRLSRVVIVQGQQLKESRTGHNVKLHAKTQVLYSCVDVDEFDPAQYSAEQVERIKQTLGLPPATTVVGMIGNLNRLKGHAYFIEAAREIKEKVPSTKFLIIGHKLDTDRAYWEQLQHLAAGNGLEDDIVYAGFREDIPAVLAVMDVFVLASVLESCPVVVLEAMAMERPIVATDVGAVSELIGQGDSGLIVPSQNATALARAVQTLLDHPEDARRMARAARKRVESKYAVDRIAAQQRRLYEELTTST